MCKKAYLKKTHAHNKSWWKSIHHVSLQNYFTEAVVCRCF